MRNKQAKKLNEFYRIIREIFGKKKTSPANSLAADTGEVSSNGNRYSPHSSYDTKAGNEKQVQKLAFPSLGEQANTRVNDAASSGNFDLAEKHLRILNNVREIENE